MQDNWNNNYENTTNDNIIFDASWSVDTDWNVVRMVISDWINTLYDGNNLSYTFTPNHSLRGKTVNYTITIYDDDWASSQKTVTVTYDI